MRHISTRFLIAVCLICAPLLGSAQEASTPDFDAWDRVATEVERQLDLSQPSEISLESSLSELFEWREDFLDAQDVNTVRIATLQAQITALGDVPEEGESELSEITQRRDTLLEQLDAAQAPAASAKEAYTRADGLIGEIDATLVSLQTDALLAIGPSPLNPKYWASSASSLGATLRISLTTIIENAASQNGQDRLRAQSGTIILYLVLGGVFVSRGRRWSEQLTRSIREIAHGATTQGVAGFIVSLGQVLMPVLGLYAFSSAAQVSGLLGARGDLILEAVPTIGFAYFGARWIMGRLFYPNGHGDPVMDLSPSARREITIVSMMLGVIWTLKQLLNELADIDAYSAATVVVLSYPMVVFACLGLFYLARLMARAGKTKQEEPVVDKNLQNGTLSFFQLITKTLVRAVRLGAITGFVLASIGFTAATNALVFPMILTLGLLCLVLTLSRFLSDLYVLLAHQNRESARGAKEGLVPVLISTLLVLGALPFWALIWGTREAQLWEIWAKMREGVSIGDAQVSVTDFLTFTLIFIVGLGLTRLIKSALSTAVLPKTKLDKGGQNAMVAGAGYLGIFLSGIIAITAAGIDLSALAIVAGALSVGIGFGLQNIVQNFVSGIILLIERPISEGDWIEVGGKMGIVRDISVRSTRVESFDRTDLIVPNADLISSQVTNYTHGNLVGRVIVAVGVGYGSDTRQVSDILMEIAKAHPLVAVNPEPQVLFLNFGADALEFEIRAVLRDVTFILSVKNDINHEIARRFSEEGIEIPFAQRDIWLRNPEALGMTQTGHGPSNSSPQDDKNLSGDAE